MILNCEKGCGKCCEVQGTDKVLMTTRSEAERIAAVTGRTMDRSAGRPLHKMVLGITRAAPCPFLKEGACTIYEDRPAVCRAYRCNGTDPWVKSAESLVDCEALAANTADEVSDLRVWFPESLDAVFARHTKIAFQFSGGKDSTAVLLKLRPYWNRMTVFHLNTGDQHPETTAMVERIARMIPITVIRSDVFAVKRRHGLPADVVPWTSTERAHECNAGFTPLLQDRVSCCYRTTMEPLHNAMKAAGVTLIVRGQKNRDSLKGAFQSGDVADGFEFLYPFSDMTDEDCFNVLREHDITIPSYYGNGLTHSGDCLGCTAWNAEESRPAYLRQYFPEHYKRYRLEMLTIADAVEKSAVGLFKTANECLHADH
jgi:3'-phosphoadenosine 5'-phosphosulfate sulfotransferase (PAPS reductase)/FAD synthetase